MTRIGDSAFYKCTELSSVTIPDGLCVIRERTFKDCTRLGSIDLPASVIQIEGYAFQNSGLTSLTIPGEAFWGIYDGAFQGCASLGSITLSAREPVFEEFYLGVDIFDGTPAGFKVYVPTHLVEDYKNNEYWAVYADRIEAIPSEP